MTPFVRNAWPTDDLAVLWPALSTRKLNLQQVLLAVDDDADEAILGGILLFDGGHEVAFVGEFTMGPGATPKVAQVLIDQLFRWAQHEGKTTLVFHMAPEGPFLAHLLKLGARVTAAPIALVTMNTGVPAMKTEENNR